MELWKYTTDSMVSSWIFFFSVTFIIIVSQEVQSSSQALQEEKAEVKRRLEEANARVVQLEEDLIGVTQKGLQKETELDRWVLGIQNSSSVEFKIVIFF